MRLEDHIDVLKEYPFKVGYPHGGTLHLLVWRTYHERNHVIAAPRVESLGPTYRRVLEVYGHEAEPVALWRVEVVSPPLELRRDYALGRLSDDVDDFRRHVGRLFSQAVRNAKERPETHPHKRGARRCPGYKARWGPQTGDKTHSYCINCFDGWLPRNHSVESLYLRHREEPREWRAGFSSPGRVGARKPSGELEFRESTAPDAQSSRPLYVLEQRFGNHSDGLSIQKVERYEGTGDYGYGPASCIHPPVFFFHGEELEVPSEYKALVEAERMAYEKREERSDAARKEQRRRECEAESRQLSRFLEDA